MMNLLRGIAGICLASLLGGAPVALCAEAPVAAAAAPAKEGQRYLLVVDTSRSMRTRLTATLDLLEHLLTTGLDGRLHRGDTIGLWTFGSELQTGAFPLQTWSPEQRRNITLAVTGHLQGSRFTGSTAIRKPVDAALEIVRESEAITIILITDGEESIKGTPFDMEINTAFQREGRPMRAAGLPFAVFLAGHGGKVTAYAVNSVFQPLAYPKDEAIENEPVPKPSEPVTAKPPIPAPPPLKVETKPAEPAAPLPLPTETKSEASTPVVPESKPTSVQPTVIVPTNVPVLVNDKGSVVLPQPVITPTTEPAPIIVTNETKPEPAKTIEPVAEVKPATPSTPATLPAITSTTPPATTPIPENAVVTAPPIQPTPVIVSEAAPPKPAEVVAVVTQVVATLPPVPPTPATNILPVVTPTESSVPAVSTGALAAATSSVPVESKPAEAAPVTNAPGPLIAAIPPEAGYSTRALLIAAFALLAVAAGLMLLLFRRRAPAGASIISRSMDQDKH